MDRLPRAEASSEEDDYGIRKIGKGTNYTPENELYDYTVYIVLACCTAFLALIVLVLIIYIVCLKLSRKRHERSSCHSNHCHAECSAHSDQSSHGTIHGHTSVQSGDNVIQTLNTPVGVTSFPGSQSPFHSNNSWIIREQNQTATTRAGALNDFQDTNITQPENECAMDNVRQTRAQNTKTERDQSVSNVSMTSLIQSRGVQNPIFNGDDDETHVLPFGLENSLHELYTVTERSVTHTVCGKLLVSIARNVGHEGDILILDNMGISLKVPKGAVKIGEKQMIVLVLNWDLSDNPSMKTVESLVSPVVYVGPHGLKLNKQCVLTFRHCSYNPRQIRVMRSETEITDQKSWRTMVEQNLESGPAYLSPTECQISIDTFTLYTCVQAPLDEQIGKKWLQIAVFACPLRKQSDHYQFRVYFLNKTNCALQWAIQSEASFGGKQVCPEKVFLFDGNDHDMFTLTNYISPGWELLEREDVEKVSFLSIWHGQCPHISVCFKRSLETKPDTESTNTDKRSVSLEMNIKLLTYQSDLEDFGEKIFIQISEDNVTEVHENEPSCTRSHLDNIHIHIHPHPDLGSGPSTSNVGKLISSVAGSDTPLRNSNDSTQSKASDKSVNIFVNPMQSNVSGQNTLSDPISLSAHAPKPILPHDVKKKLMLMLDPLKYPHGHDWKDFASAIGKDDVIEYMASHAGSFSPTEQLLKEVEAKHMTAVELKSIFKQIERLDCVKVIDDYLSSINARPALEPIENSFVGNSEVLNGNPNQNNLQSEGSSKAVESSFNSFDYKTGTSYHSENKKQASRKVINIEPTLDESSWTGDSSVIDSNSNTFSASVTSGAHNMQGLKSVRNYAQRFEQSSGLWNDSLMRSNDNDENSLMTRGPQNNELNSQVSRKTPYTDPHQTYYKPNIES